MENTEAQRSELRTQEMALWLEKENRFVYGKEARLYRQVKGLLQATHQQSDARKMARMLGVLYQNIPQSRDTITLRRWPKGLQILQRGRRAAVTRALQNFWTLGLVERHVEPADQNVYKEETITYTITELGIVFLRYEKTQRKQWGRR